MKHIRWLVYIECQRYRLQYFNTLGSNLFPFIADNLIQLFVYSKPKIPTVLEKSFTLKVQVYS